MLLFHDFLDPDEIFRGVYGDGVKRRNYHRNGKTMFQGSKLLEFFQVFQNSNRELGELLQKTIAVAVKAQVLVIGWG